MLSLNIGTSGNFLECRNTDSSAYMRNMLMGISECVGEALEYADTVPVELKKVMTNNYNLGALEALSALLLLPEGKVFTDNVATISHAFSADNIINLVSYCKVASVKKGDRLLLVGSGIRTWGSIVIEKI